MLLTRYLWICINPQNLCVCVTWVYALMCVCECKRMNTCLCLVYVYRSSRITHVFRCAWFWDSNSCLHPCMASSVSMEPSPPPLLLACWTIIGRLKEKLFKKTNEHLLGVLIVSGAVWGAESTVANKGRAFAPTHLLASGGHDNERARKQHMNTLPTVWYRSAGCKQ